MDKNTETGVTRSSKEVIGKHLPDPFFDCYEEEVLTCHDIVNLAADKRTKHITITIDRAFLKKIAWSHIHEICRLAKE